MAEIANDFRDVVGFKSTEDLGYVDKSVNKTRRFKNFCDSKVDSFVREDLLEVSEAYPTAVLLLTYWDMQWSFTGKQVIRGGTIVQEVCDDQQRSQAVDWVLLDIFAPSERSTMRAFRLEASGRNGSTKPMRPLDS